MSGFGPARPAPRSCHTTTPMEPRHHVLSGFVPIQARRCHPVKSLAPATRSSIRHRSTPVAPREMDPWQVTSCPESLGRVRPSEIREVSARRCREPVSRAQCNKTEPVHPAARNADRRRRPARQVRFMMSAEIFHRDSGTEREFFLRLCNELQIKIRGSLREIERCVDFLVATRPCPGWTDHRHQLR